MDEHPAMSFEPGAARPPAIGFLGTGIMGAHMARRIAQAGYEIAAWNRTAEKVDALAGFGVRSASDPKAAARDADILICMLSSGPVCDEALIEGGVLDAMRPGGVLIVMSSIPVLTARRQANLAAEKGIGYLDAPVSGGETG